MNENDYQRRIIDTAKQFGWRVVHIRNIEIAKGRWTVPYEGDKGLPDLILARDQRALLVEIKTDKGRVTPDQQAWIDASGGVVWRPDDWPRVLAFLSTRRAA